MALLLMNKCISIKLISKSEIPFSSSQYRCNLLIHLLIFCSTSAKASQVNGSAMCDGSTRFEWAPTGVGKEVGHVYREHQLAVTGIPCPVLTF